MPAACRYSTLAVQYGGRYNLRTISHMWLSLPSVGLAPRIVLLQHANEPSRPTGTGKLLAHESLAPFLRFEQWTWAGRADNDKIERQVAQLDRPTLLWTSSNSDEAAATPTADADYIIIDATWQEARKMFRKLECLQTLPRVAIDIGGPSSYKLRADFGWRERFGFSADAPEPLCTAEAPMLARVMEATLNPRSRVTTCSGSPPRIQRMSYVSDGSARARCSASVPLRPGANSASPAGA